MLIGFKTRSEVVTMLNALLRLDNTKVDGVLRWTTDEVVASINMALQFWAGSVSLPATCEVDTSDTADLPWYVGSIEAVYSGDKPIRLTQEIPNWDYHTLEVPPTVSSVDIVFPLCNLECSIPETSLKLADAYSSGGSSMSLSISDPANVPETGVLKMDNIWYAYVLESYDSTSAELTILKAMPRGNIEAATFAAGTTVEMGLFVTDPSLWGHLSAHSMSTLHSMFAAYGSVSDIENIQWFMRWWDARAEVLWKRYKPRPPLQRAVLK